jgi:polyferredoxin
MTRKRQFQLNVLRSKAIRHMVFPAYFPVALQGVALAGIVFLMVNGWGIGLGEPEQQLMTLRKTNLTTLFVWGLWWPGMIAVALLAGRLWCTVCPMELVNRIGHAVGRVLGLHRPMLGPWLRRGWFVVVAYLLLQLLVAGMSIHRVPHYTSLMLIGLMTMALGSGLYYREERSFCKAFCPAKALLSVYGRFTPVQLDVNVREICKGCATRDCVDPRKRDRFNARACPSLVRPYDRRKGDECVLCLQCAKVCPHGNVGFGLAAKEAASRRHGLLQPFEALFVLFAAGFVAHDVIGETKPVDELFHFVPTLLNQLAPGVDFGWFEAGWFLLLVPALLGILAAGLAWILGHRGTWRELFISAATGAAPVVAIAHLAKAVAKLSSWGGFLPLAVRDPAGLESLHQIGDKSIAAPGPLFALSLLGWMMLLALLAIAWRNRRWLQESAVEHLPAAHAGFAVCTAFYAATLLAWPWF